ncbi:13867_t:CDS:2 [Funneliformis geosporum]|uniref:2406_t:CDS:1 n=1 Tax=Funneliformis geosporum TaxID=1117311 RepID=A0A9W4SZE2_9GLOM|nr:13867_t:CDS:2 [Funneliformis geosporum]CAI2187042.1 2406_t:CDS:2 [Funneliformis geosporum]
MERKPSDTPPSENPIIKREREIKEEILRHFSLEESEIETLLPQISYVGDSYPDLFKPETSLEEKLAISTQIIKNHKVRSFTNIPTSVAEFSQKVRQIFKEKETFLILSLCPHKSDGIVDKLSKEPNYQFNYFAFEIPSSLTGVGEKVAFAILDTD